MLGPVGAEAQIPGFVHNQGLFSAHFLSSRLPVPNWGDEALDKLKELQAHYQAVRGGVGSWNEAQTESEFIRPLLEMLGWHFIPQVPLARGGRRNFPDYALFGDAAAKAKATTLQRQPEKFFPLALAIADAKYWGRTLDAESPKDSRDTSSNANPGFQIINYLVGSDVAWGILTNGQVWRLYAQRVRSRTTTFYEVNLEEALQSGDREAFRYFAFFFHRAAFQSDPATGQSFLDRVLTESADYAVQVQDELKDLVFEKVVPLLVQGLVAWRKSEEGRRAETAETLAALHQSTLTLLYRLLFLLYAEARDLLPVREERGYYPYSLTHLRREVAERKDRGVTMSKRSTDLWDDLTNLFRMVASGDPSLNVPIYNGGLFKNKPDGGEIPMSVLKIADAYLGDAIDLLARRDDRVSGRRVFIDYKDLDVRHLGSIYEGLLEFQPRIAAEDLTVKKEKRREVWAAAGGGPVRVRKGEVYLANEKGQRKATGSYYTPDYIVKYIVASTLGPLLDEREARFNEQMKQVAGVRRKLANEADPARNRLRRTELERLEEEAVATLLDVKVCDPAMGSGHFLVEAVGYLTDRFASILAQHPANPLITLIRRVRGQIMDNLRGQGLTPDPAHLDDKHLLKRMVMKRCIYGVDLNRMAVELAKLSLWLDSFTVGAPLSFLDHHLKWGNSLIGARVDEVRRALESETRIGQDRTQAAQFHMFGGPFAGLLTATGLMRDVTLLSDATFEQVEQSGEKYSAFEKEILPYKRVLDIWVSRHFGVERGEDFLRLYGGEALKAVANENVRLAPEYSRVIAEARSLYESKRFFHWDLEFPEAFIDLARASWKANPGFDAVVGNPPWGGLRTLGNLERALKSTYRTAGGAADWFALFLECEITLASEGGRVGQVIPGGWQTAAGSKVLRKAISEKLRIESFVNLPYDVFPEAYTEAVILVGQVVDDSEPAWIKARPNLLIYKRRERVSQITEADSRWFTVACADWFEIDPDTFSFFTFWTSEMLSLAKKVISASIRLKSIADVQRGITPFVLVERKPKGSFALALEGKLVRYEYEFNGTHCVEYHKSIAEYKDLKYFRGKRVIVRQLISRQFRLQSVLANEDFIVNQSHQVVLLTTDEYRPSYILALLNSMLMSYYQVRRSALALRDDFPKLVLDDTRALPIRRITFTTPPTRRAQLVKKGIGLAERSVESGGSSAVRDFVRERLAHQPEQGDVLHDLLAHLAQQMTEMNKAKEKEIREFLKWLGTYAGLAVDKWKLKTIAQDYAPDSWENFQRALRANAKAFIRDMEGRAAASKLETEWIESVDKLRPLLARIEATDRLIDRIVYELYGLTEGEINLVEGESVKRN